MEREASHCFTSYLVEAYLLVLNKTKGSGTNYTIILFHCIIFDVLGQTVNTREWFNIRRP